ncbi:DUF1799 domain-containing protein [Shewanella eurypsychrophilus]|uniref:DUF1799 domain-containing protein n=1 Tax=Shewanella eurypsychrophilus TaxID=2593656 RepID=A0ABX6V8E8_9GAMM|nr:MULTISPECIES: DUF1799 domain-containing protein [Shewanella]QFU23726.1 hypothetical protein FS418_18935 [Shewanella sp. YLB-09]QPG58946.1 DUF1799 domain-containing protein [Shewanella eurypsychrophilus]
MRQLYAADIDAEQDRLNEQANQWNAPPEVLAQLANQLPDDEDVVIWPENHLTMNLFFSCQTQWHFAGMAGVRTGLNWQSLELAMSRSAEFRSLDDGTKDEVFDELVLVERVVLKAIREHESLQKTKP